jgi:hypothetical protein
LPHGCIAVAGRSVVSAPNPQMVWLAFSGLAGHVRISGDREHGFQTIVSSYFAGS